jgi:transporter family protein
MPLRVFILLIVTAILWGSSPIIEKSALDGANPLVGVTIRSLAISVVLIIIMLLSGRMHEVLNNPLKNTVLFCVSGLIAGLLGMLTYFHALRIAPASKVVPIAGAYPLVAAILGAVILGENVTFIRILGTLLIITGVWLVK